MSFPESPGFTNIQKTMTDKRKIFTLPDALKEIRDQAFKHVNLCELDGQPLVTYNIVAKPVEPKLKEIEKRWKSLPDGVYLMNCKGVYGSKTRGFPYYVCKGNMSPDVKLPEFVQEKAPEKKNTLAEVNVLSYEQALEKESKIKSLEYQVQTLTKEVADLKLENAELETQLQDAENEEAEGAGLSDLGEKLGNWAEKIMPVLAPLADQFFQLQNKRLQHEQIKLMHEAGYELPGVKKARNGLNGHKRPVDYNTQIPQPGTAGWSEYIDWVCSLPDAQFDAHLDMLKAANVELYNAVEAEVLEAGGEHE